MRDKINLLLVLAVVLAWSGNTVTSHAIPGRDHDGGEQKKSDSSCAEDAIRELVCSEEVLEAIKREDHGIPPIPPPATEAPPAEEAPPENGDDLYYDDYYDE